MSYEYYPQIKRALSHAPRMHYEQGIPVFPNLIKFSVFVDGDDISELHDFSTAQLGYDDGELPGSTIAVKTPEQLENLYMQHLRYNRIYDKSTEEFNRDIKHQVETADISAQLGAKDGNYFLSVSGYDPSTGAIAYSLGHQTLHLTTTLIGAALREAYPTEPSLSGLANVRSYGYDGVDDVGCRAELYSMPLPLSYKPS